MVRAALTNPLEQDPVLKELLQKLDLIETRRGFARWKQHFLRQFESHLEGESIQKAGQKYHAFARRLDRLVLLLKAMERLMATGDLSMSKITVKSRQSLGELQKQLTGMIRHIQALVPGTLDQEMQAGYTKFDMGAVLVRDGFVEYDRLCLCRDVLRHMREALLEEIADRQLLEEMVRYELHLEAFCGIMGNDLGLQGAMLKCRSILRSNDEDFYRYEQPTKQQSTHESAASEYDNDSYWEDGEEGDDEYEENDDEEEEEESEDDDDEEEEEEDDDDESSDFSDVIELCGMEIPLRLTKHSKGSSHDTYLSFEDDDVSELSYDSSWEWSLQVPAPPKPSEKKKVSPRLGLPSAPTLDEEEDNEHSNGVDQHEREEVDLELQHDIETEMCATQQHENGSFQEETSIVRHDSVVHPPKHSDASGSSLLGHDDEEEEDDEHERSRSTLMDSKHASTVSSLTHSQPSSHPSPPSSPHARLESLEEQLPQAKEIKTPKLSSPESSPTKKNKVVVKARLRKKPAANSDSSDELSNDGTNSLDINDERVIIRRRGSKKKKVSRPTTANTSGSVSSQETSNTNSDDASNKLKRWSSFSRRDSGSEDVSSCSAGSLHSELDSARHARRKQNTDNKPPKAKRRSSLRRSGSARSNSSRKSTELRRMAHRAAKRRGGEEGTSDDASKGSLRSIGSQQPPRRSGSLRSLGSQQSLRSLSGKNDPLHNLLFNKKAPASNKNKEDDSIDTPNHDSRSRIDSDDLDSPLTSPASSPAKGRKNKSSLFEDEGKYVVEDDARERTKLCYKWYGRLGHPSRDTFKRRVRTASKSTFDGLTEDDVDLLPWIHGGARINSNEMTKLLVGDVMGRIGGT